MTLPKDPIKKEEYLRKASERMKGHIPWNKGLPMRPESKIKLSLSNKGKKSWNEGRGSNLKIIKERFESKIEILITNCWLWKGHIENTGYGRFNINNKPISAHRFSYMLFVGPIDLGLTIDHLCRNRWCVNPRHLEVVSIKENLLRSNNITTINQKKEFCKNGHQFTVNNTYIRPRGGGRDCRICHASLQRLYLDRKKRGVDVP